MPPTASTTDAESPTTASTSRLVPYGLIALLTVVVGNGAILVVATDVFGVPAGFPLSWGPVLASSAIPAVGATVVYAAIARVSRRPNRPFVVVATIVLALSFVSFVFPPPELSQAPRSVYVTLGAMHVVTAVVIVGLLMRVQRPTRSLGGSR